MAKWGHYSALNETDLPVVLRPARQPIPLKARAPAEPPRHRREPLLEHPAQTGLSTNVVDQDDLAPGPQHPRELVQCGLGIRNHRDHVLSDHDVEGAGVKAEPLAVHDRKAIEVAE